MRFLLTLILLVPFTMAVAQSEVLKCALTIETLVREPLNIVSGEAGVNRDWEKFRALFTPNARFGVLMRDSSGSSNYKEFSLEEMVRIGRRGYEKNGFIEYELNKTIDQYNGIAHVFQGYYAKGTTHEEKGINSYQLMHDGTRWWITGLIWTSDKLGMPLPKAYDKD